MGLVQHPIGQGAGLLLGVFCVGDRPGGGGVVGLWVDSDIDWLSGWAHNRAL